MFSLQIVVYRAYKTVEEADCKLPLIYGEGKRVSGCFDANACEALHKIVYLSGCNQYALKFL